VDSSGVGSEFPLSEHDVLDLRECELVRNEVLELRQHWTSRSERSGFFSLGAAAYLDAPQCRDAYLKSAHITNPLLHRAFQKLYVRVQQFFEALFEQPVYFDPELALPGFHIFVSRVAQQERQNVADRAHFDLQWMHTLPGRHPAATLSFTLPIEVPSCGASMAIWQARYQDAVRGGFTGIQYASRHQPRTLPYTPGRLVVHDGLLLHAIGPAPVPTIAPYGNRITLQGHGVRLAGRWLLYW
jgi:hypothetical protein